MAASREEVYERVKEVLTEQLGVEESEIAEELEALVRRRTVRCPRRMGEDVLEPLLGQRIDQAP